MAGARWVQKEALEKQPDARLKVYAVWFEMVPGDARSRWPAGLLGDARVEHYWDSGKQVGTWYGSHADYGDGAGVWWDVWLLYGPDAAWTDKPSHGLGHGRTIVGSREQLRAKLAEVLGSGQGRPSTPPSLEEAKALFDEERWGEAAEAYRSVAARHPAEGAAWHGLGEALKRLGRLDEALDALQRAFSLDHLPLRTTNLLAAVHALKGDRSGTLAWLERWVVLARAKGVGAYRPGREFDQVRDDARIDEILTALRPCRGELYASFGPFLGTWVLLSPHGGRLGEVELRTLEDGCGVLEIWTEDGGATATSLTAYHKATKQWRQSLIDNRGDSLALAGRFDGTTLILTSSNEAFPLKRRTLRPAANGRLSHLWEESFDDGRKWSRAAEATLVKDARPVR